MHSSIRVRLRISERAAYNMVVAMAMHGDHGINEQPPLSFGKIRAGDDLFSGGLTL